MSVTLTVGLLQFFGNKITNMNSFENVSYNTIEFKNKFENSTDTNHMDSGNILIDDYTFLPSIDAKLITTDDISLI